jgi:hypothetical protein
VVEAATHVAAVDGYQVSLSGYAMYAGDGTALCLSDLGWNPNTGPRLPGKFLDSWDASGNAEAKSSWPPTSALYGLGSSEGLVFRLLCPPDFPFDLADARLLSLRHQIDFTREDNGGIKGGNVIRDGTAEIYVEPRLPLAGPVELRLSLVRGGRETARLTAKEGTTIATERNGYGLIGLWHSIVSVERDEGVPPETDRFTIRPRGTGHRASPMCAAVLYSALPINPGCMEVTAVSWAERRYAVSERGSFRRFGSGSLLPCLFRCDADHVAAFEISEATSGFEARFPLEGIPGFPEENRGVTEVLSLRLPYFTVTGPGRIRADHFRKVLGPAFASRRAYGGTSPPAGGHQHRSLHEILDYTYPGRWWVEDGRVYVSRRHSESLLHKVLRAVRGN